MAFTVRDFESLVRLLDRHPEWLEALRQRLLTRELLRAPETLREIEGTLRALAEAQRRHYEEFLAHRAETDRRLAALQEEVAAARAEADRRFAELAEAQRRTEERVEQLAEAQRRTQEEIRSLAQAQRTMQDTLDDFHQALQAMQGTMDRFNQTLRAMQSTLDRFGPAVEERVAQALRAWVEGQGGTLLGVIASIALDGIGEVDGAVPVRFPDGREGWVLVSAKAKAWPRTIREFVEGILQNPQARAGLRAAGVGERVWPVVFAMATDQRAPGAAQEAGVGLLLGGQGMVVPPLLWSLEEGAPLGR